MVNVTFVHATGRETTVDGAIGKSVMRLATENGIAGILADCGGVMSCATCHVHVRPEWLERTGAAAGTELEMLEMAVDPDDTSRLSCQIRLSEALDGLIVDIPASQF
jgi:2Fe-2S ferredoxin